MLIELELKQPPNYMPGCSGLLLFSHKAFNLCVNQMVKDLCLVGSTCIFSVFA